MGSRLSVSTGTSQARAPSPDRRTKVGNVPSAGRVLVVEDEDKLRRVIQLELESAGYEVDSAPSAEQALPLASLANVIVTDLRLPGMDGLQFIKQLQTRGLPVATIVITAHGSVDLAVEAMKLGAAD